jgi:hypothetical protein
MPYFAVDDAFHAHPKAMALRAGRYEAEALALWAKAGSWCQAGLTDGHIPRYVVEGLLKRNALKGAAELVRVGLWHETESGWAFHQWSDHQFTAAEVKAKRAEAKERMRRNRSGNTGMFQVRSREHVENVRENSMRTCAERSSTPSHPIPTQPKESASALSARATPQLDERVSFADAQDAFSRLRVEHGGGPFRAQMRDHAKVTELADFATSTGKTRAERVAVLEAVVRGYLATADQWCIDRGYPVSGMHDFGVLLARGRRVRPKDDPESPIAKVRAEMAQLLPYYEGKKREKDVEAHSLKERRYVELQAELRALQRAEREQAERGAA